MTSRNNRNRGVHFGALSRRLRYIFVIRATLSLSCSSSAKPYSFAHVMFCATEGKFLYIAVERETGESTTLFGPHPKTTYSNKVKRIYKLTYALAAPQKKPDVSAPIQMDEDRGRREFVNVADPGEAWICYRLAIPRVSAMYTHLTPNQFSVEIDSLPIDEQKQLKTLGFNKHKSIKSVKRPDGVWYLGFDSSSECVQVCCPAQKVIREKALTADGSSIWDVERSRLLIISEKNESGKFLELPKSVTVWDYKNDVLTKYELIPVEDKEAP